MTEGFVYVNPFRFVQQDKWTEGRPQRSWFGRILLTRKKRYAVTAYRCPQCGKLELYAMYFDRVY